MTTEERKMLYDRFHSGALMMTERLERICKEKATWTFSEMSYVADIMKDMSEVEKNIAKAHMYYCEHTEETF